MLVEPRGTELLLAEHANKNGKETFLINILFIYRLLVNLLITSFLIDYNKEMECV